MTGTGQEWDGREVLISEDEPSGATIVIALHSLRGGRSIGGTRIKQYAALADAVTDAQRLAAGMSLKWAAAGIESGGAKAVIALNRPLPPVERVELLHRYGRKVAQLEGQFLTGPDLGTTSEDMDRIADTAPGCVFGRTPAAGGAGDPSPYTARGVFEAIRLTAERSLGSDVLDGRRVLIQGMGKVASTVAELLAGEGARVLFSDVDPGIIEHWRGKGLEFVPPDRAFETACELFSPCAVGGVLNSRTIPLLRCRAIAGGANNQLAGPEDASSLSERDILYAPDFIANCGGAIALIGLETEGRSAQECTRAVVQAVRDNLGQVFTLAASDGCSTDEAARRLATARLEA